MSDLVGTEIVVFLTHRLKCMYNDQRVELFQTLMTYHPLPVELLMSGNLNLTTEEDNQTIFEAVHTFIRTSSRFDGT